MTQGAKTKENKSRVIGVIPARFASTRFPGKVLADLLGKPMIQHVYERAEKAELLDDLIVACDDERIVKVVEGFGGKACLTKSDHASGSDRIAEVIRPLNCSVAINIQADEPLVTPHMINQLVRGLLESDSSMSTLARKMESREGFDDPNVVKVVCDEDGFALYFSRAPIPYAREGRFPRVWYKHMGFYGYKREFLLEMTRTKPTFLEITECLEQLRVLEKKGKIKVMLSDEDSMGVDTPQDLEEVKKFL